MQRSLTKAIDKHEAFLQITKAFTPVFHHFFFEHFPDPAIWVARRETYTKSVAITSIVGHMIESTTGQLVHIDFGIVFDQGMTLLKPETVPFRLTRDMVDGMGYLGVKGVFTTCCEETLHLLRSHTSLLTTIVDVLVHDPIFRWGISPLKAQRMEQKVISTVESDNRAAAARTVLKIKQKIEGYEDPNGTAMSVEGQVKRLITVAQDPTNLCALFPGWSPWL